MMLSEIPSPQKERDTQMLSAVYSELGNKPESMVIATPKDRLIVAGVSLVMLLFLSGLTFGATNVLHMGSIGCVVVLAVIVSQSSPSTLYCFSAALK